MRDLLIDQSGESALAFLFQACLSDNLLVRSGLTPEQAEHMLVAIRDMDEQLMDRAVSDG